MISKKMEKAINDQINAELYSAYLYLSMAGYFDGKGMKGAAHWMRVQAQEETTHAMKFYLHVYDRQGSVQLSAIKAPPTTWKSPEAVFADVCEHEAKVTALINNLVDLANREKDPASGAFLQWFVTEQVEEEASAREILDQLKLNGDNGPGLILLDRELATRTFIYPPPALGGAGGAAPAAG